MSQFGFLQIISRPTRVTDNSATLIDHVYVNDVENTLSCNIITTDISDHLGTLTTIALDGNLGPKIAMRVNHDKKANSKYRIFNESNNQKFRELIDSESWDKISDETNVNVQYEMFTEIYVKHYNTAYPTIKNKVRRKNERKNSKPWILPWLEDAIKRKQKSYHDFVKNNSAANKATYNKLNKFCRKHVNLAKKKYYKKSLMTTKKIRKNSGK